MKRHVRLFEDFEPQQPKRELWVRFIGYDEEILGVHPSEQDALDAQEEFVEAMKQWRGPSRGSTPEEIASRSFIMMVDPSNKNQSAELVYYCRNTFQHLSFYVSDPFAQVPGTQPPNEILRELIEYGINPFEGSGNYEVFTDLEELEEFFDGDLSWYPGGERGLNRHLDVLNRRNKTRNLFGV